MATIPKNKILAVMTTTDAPPAMLWQDEDATESFVTGVIVYLDPLTGRLNEIGGDTPEAIYGVAHSPATGTTANSLGVWLADPTTIFEGNVLQGSAADHVLVAADIGTPMAIQRVTADGRVYLNAGTKAGANCRVFVHGVAKGSAIGDTNARVLFTFLPKFVQHLTSS